MQTPWTRAGIADLAARSGEDVRPAIEEALARRDAEEAGALVLAARRNGGATDRDLVARILPLLDEAARLPPLVGCCDRDPYPALMAVIRSGQLADEAQSIALLCAIEDLTRAPDELVVELRLHARRALDDRAALVLALCASRLDDPDVRLLAEDLLPLAESREAREILEQVKAQLADPIASLPEQEPPRAITGFTVRRALPKVGRNDPCPCGSGRKYKKCCEGREDALSWAEYRQHPHKYASAEEMGRLSPAILARLQAKDLPTAHLFATARRLIGFHFFAEAEAALDELARRGEPVDELRGLTLAEAMRAGDDEVAKRQGGLLEDATLREVYAIDLALLKGGKAATKAIESRALRGLADENSPELIDLAHALLGPLPALGILVARAALHPERKLDVETLLDEVENARDRLLLPAGDTAWDTYDLLLDREAALRIQQAAQHERAAESERLIAETERGRERLRAASERIRELERRLHQQEAELATRVEEAAPRRNEPRAPPVPPSDVRKLRDKVDRLKSLIREGQQERAELRRQLGESAERLDQTQAAPTEPEDELEIEAELPERRVLVPVYGEAVRAELADLPARIGRETLRVVAAIAGGEDVGSMNVKRLAGLPDVWSARIGIHHRVLFRMREGSLEVAHVVHRQQLDATIKRLK